MNILLDSFNNWMIFLGGLGLLARACVSEMFKVRPEFSLFVEQVYQIGLRSVPLILITAISTGMVMTLQFGIGLEKFGGGPYVPHMVALSIFREMGPIFSTLMIAARVGAGIASEVGSMVVTQQVDAMRALGTSPIQKIVIPRVLAMMISVPILAVFANIVGIFGALLVGKLELHLDLNFFMQKAVRTMEAADFFTGWGKTFVFAFIIAIVSCYYGLNVKEGTKEVGIATTRSVVTSSILVLVGDFFLTKLFWIFEKWTL